MEIDRDKIDEAVLALLWLTLHDERRAWKGFDWDVLERLQSYARVWVTRPNQAARFSATLAATPSVNVTPSMTKGNWFAPFSRRHVLAAA